MWDGDGVPCIVYPVAVIEKGLYNLPGRSWRELELECFKFGRV